MKPSVIAQLLSQLEKLVQVEFESGVEFWLARDLQSVLGYTNWQNFCKVVESAATACKTSGHKVSDQFTEFSKLIAVQVLDCGSLLPLSATQPAASRRGQQAVQRKAAAGCTQSTVFNSRTRINLLTSVN